MLPHKLEAALQYIELVRNGKKKADCAISILLSKDFVPSDFAYFFEVSDVQPEVMIPELFPSAKRASFNYDKVKDTEFLDVNLPSIKNIRLEFPLDWRDPLLVDRAHLREFNALEWLPAAMLSEEGRSQALPAVAQYQSDFFNHLTPDKFTWDEHSISDRMRNLFKFVQYYCKGADELNVPLILNSLRIMLLHLFLMLDDMFYCPSHNHGLMQDVGLLTVVPSIKALKQKGEILSFVEDRLLRRQLLKSITKEYAHKENSPGYHLHFLKSLSKILKTETISDDLRHNVETIMVETLRVFLYFVWPDRTLVTFGDTARQDVSEKVLEYISSIDPGFDFPKQVIQKFRSETTESRLDLAPDIVLRSVGYASFRTYWDFSSAGANGTCVVQKSGCRSQIHKHEDDGSFQFFGLGQELIIDPAKFSNDRTRKEALGGCNTTTHNVFRFESDPADFKIARANIQESWFASDRVCYTVCRQFKQKKDSRPDVYRILVFKKPDELIVIDAFKSHKPGKVCWSQVGLHPSLSFVRNFRGNLDHLVIRPDGKGFSLSLFDVANTQTAPCGEFDVIEAEIPYFPRAMVAEKTSQVRLKMTSRSGINALAYRIKLFDSEASADFAVPSVRINNGTLRLSSEDVEFSLRVFPRT
ncbi:heparinase II/III family protein [Ponticaulis profundi]|uniref:Heparinase II/III family protein n=1 Tax=Ponticaulis profundi TaxID=2665222 RepID=A0ABW1SAE5_9PROT